MSDTEKMALALRISDLAGDLLILQEQQQTQISNLLQSVYDYQAFLETASSLKQPNTPEKG